MTQPVDLRSLASLLPEGSIEKIQQGVLAQQVARLSLEIYARAASLSACDSNLGPELYRQVAKNSRMAAKAYFDGLGFDDQSQPSP